MTASDAKQNFGQALERASVGPIGIERHGKLVAALVPAEWLDKANLLDDRRIARDQQQQVEQRRLMAHQRIAIDLLSHEETKKQLLEAARGQVRRWAEQGLCSQDYIDRWTEWLSLPDVELVDRMCSDAGGWGRAMRQNSPFAVAPR
ncbi:MAG TPA: type II toxin-antitoxin system Phd/YefM family antitoxin [Ramlibacter sp.]|nr:type II toxin-antitoxin system Phd/YefM family antitoxin [Ramlibacter sp.]